jgi:hypothetical protein
MGAGRICVEMLRQGGGGGSRIELLYSAMHVVVHVVSMMIYLIRCRKNCLCDNGSSNSIGVHVTVIPASIQSLCRRTSGSVSLA